MGVFSAELNDLKLNSQLRKISDITAKSTKFIEIEGKRFLNFSSNNYLNIADNIEIYDKFLPYLALNIDSFSFGSASARLLTGNLPVYSQLESLLAGLYKKESCLIFNSGYHANVGIMSSLAQKGDVIFSDKLNHASIIDGMKLSDAEFVRYKHLDFVDLENKLSKNRNKYKRAVIVTESVFSMDGDICNLKKLVEIKKKYNAILVVDEAHAFGVFGHNALGIAEDQGIIEYIDVIIATFGKAIGSMGAFAVASTDIISFFTNKARPFIFSTALPPINILWTKFIIEDILPSLAKERTYLLRISDVLRNKLVEYDITTAGNSQIVPVITKDNQKTVLLAEKLKHLGFLTLPIRPPTVPPNSSRLRISLTCDIEEFEIIQLAEAIRDNICL